MTKRNIFLFLGLAVGVFGLLLIGSRPVAAQNPQPTPSDDDVNRVARQMYCPVCENIPLDVCPTQACHDWRELIRQKLAQGWSDQQIKDYFAQQYGDRVLDEPPQRGLNLVVYIAPVVLFLGGVILVWRVMVSMRARSMLQAGAGNNRQAALTEAPEDAPYLARLEEELKKKE
jgi:cytochrome c-type biogenesis protein CcmH